MNVLDCKSEGSALHTHATLQGCTNGGNPCSHWKWIQMVTAHDQPLEAVLLRVFKAEVRDAPMDVPQLQLYAQSHVGWSDF